MTHSTPPEAHAPPLEYAPAPPVVRSRWFRRLVLLCLLLPVAIGAWRYGGRAWDHVRVLWWQRACMAYAQPPGRVVYTDNAIEATALQRTTGDYIRFYSTGPAFLRDLPAYQGLSSLVGYTAGSGGAMAFMHERTNDAGQRRLVVVYVSQAPTLTASVYIPATLTSPGGWAPGKTECRFASGLLSGRRVFAGQSDAGDRSAFTIPAEAGGVPRTIRGKLVGDSIKFSVE